MSQMQYKRLSERLRVAWNDLRCDEKQTRPSPRLEAPAIQVCFHRLPEIYVLKNVGDMKHGKLEPRQRYRKITVGCKVQSVSKIRCQCQYLMFFHTHKHTPFKTGNKQRVCVPCSFTKPLRPISSKQSFTKHVWFGSEPRKLKRI